LFYYIYSALNFLSSFEGKTNTVKFAFGQTNIFRKTKPFLKEIYRVVTYDSSKNTSADDLAVIVLKSAVKTNKIIGISVPSTETTTDFYVGDNLFTCGLGEIDNYRNRTKGLILKYIIFYSFTRK
jgi:hypothetical protein